MFGEDDGYPPSRELTPEQEAELQRRVEEFGRAAAAFADRLLVEILTAG